MHTETMSRLFRPLAAFCLGILVLCCAAGSALAAFDGEDTLTVGVPVDRCPVFYLEAEGGEVAGIGVDLMKSAAAAAGYQVRFRPMGERTLKDALDNEAYDLLMPFGSAISSTAGQPSVVSANLMQTPFTLVTRDSGNLPTLNQLRVGMLRSLGGAAETVQELYPGIHITLYETMDESVKALRAGEVDALLHNSYVWSYVLQKPSYHDLSVQPAAMFSMDFRVGAPDTPKSRAILQRLDEGIASLSDTRRQAIVLDHTSRRLYRYDLGDYFYQYGAVLALSLLLLAAVAVISLQKRRELLRQQAEEMRRLVDHDLLTGALSLNGFRKRVEELLRAHPDVPYLLAYTNVRNFKFVNDSLGMQAGNELLRFQAHRTMETLSDVEAMCRMEGDHFAILRRNGGEDQVHQDDVYVIDKVRSYFFDQGKGIRLQVCGGIYVLTPEDYRHIDVDHMLDYARLAEKRVRESKKDGFAFYNQEQWERGKRAAFVNDQLPRAIHSGELQVWYQPQVNYDTGKITGAEALCRWNHPDLGWLKPGEFIPILEEAGLIYDLDRFVWNRVCQDLKRWKEQGLHCSVSVNLSRKDFQEGRNIPSHFYQLIQDYDLSADQLHIEITESAFAERPDLLIHATMKLRELGFQVEMDDFGSGYSSLHMLKEVTVDRIKLDLHFLTGTGDVERGRIILSNIVQMIHALGTDLIAEGVETAVQADFLQSQNCPEMQGYYFYKPMPVERYEALLQK